MANSTFGTLQTKIAAMLDEKRAGVSNPKVVEALNILMTIQSALTAKGATSAKLPALILHLKRAQEQL